MRGESLCDRPKILRLGGRLAEQRADCRIADCERGREREDPVAHILLAAAAERDRTSDIPYIVAAVVQEAEETAKPAQSCRAVTEAGADLEHRAGIFAGDATPILDAEHLAAQPPLHAFGDAEALQQFREQGDRLKIGAEIAVSLGHDIA